MAHPPKKLQHILWSVDVNHLDIEQDKNYIIHQILSYGMIEDFIWLFRTYSLKDVLKTFTNVPYKDYRPARFSLIKNYVLGLKSFPMDERFYVKNTPRPLGQKTPKGL